MKYIIFLKSLVLVVLGVLFYIKIYVFIYMLHLVFELILAERIGRKFFWFSSGAFETNGRK